ncbi:amidase domain-containing protein [Halalkalibacterium ligniniphilum]|uniref:amidase domain-containing protein n=1 Tax=Halalkalibacterium ligniniphilum TaxID=1134413 RepID=UPI0003455456|nr:amidase domain-containing protein [Halalkalibacterium ligniniphilum]
MVSDALKQLHALIEKRNQCFVKGQIDFLCHESDLQCIERRRERDRRRGAKTVKSTVTGTIIRRQQFENMLQIEYVVKYEYLIDLRGHLYIEEHRQHRRALFVDALIAEDKEISIPPFAEDNNQSGKSQVRLFLNQNRQRMYDRREAVRYAERWWDDYNPQYIKFENNCTNFISQCLRAGGAPMTGMPNRSKGWWFQQKNWSYTWAVANSFRWYLSGATGGLRGEERQSPIELVPGDVICYDFNGDGRWQHTTIVVAKDANGEPLVNAQTTNSRMRFWAYEDSTAWTDKIQYKFFHLPDRF